MKKSIPKVWERESEASILGNDRERGFPLTPVLNLKILVLKILYLVVALAPLFGWKDAAWEERVNQGDCIVSHTFQSDFSMPDYNAFGQVRL